MNIQKQAAELYAKMMTCLPLMTYDRMQELIDDPITLRHILERAFHPAMVFNMKTSGRSGDQCTAALLNNGTYVDLEVRLLLSQASTVPVADGRLVIIPSSEFHGRGPSDTAIRSRAKNNYHLVEPLIDVAPFVREAFSDEYLRQFDLEMLIVMHSPIKVGNDESRLLIIDTRGAGRRFDTIHGGRGCTYPRRAGFVFQDSRGPKL